jgi:hypothetical protein
VPQTLPNPPAQHSAILLLSTRRKRLEAGLQSPACGTWKSRFDAPAPLRLWHLASLDAPTVAVVWALGFAWATGVSLPLWLPILLALVAFAIYVTDRLLDARAAMRTGQLHRLRQRHTFHWRHRRLLIPLAAAAICASAWMVLALMPVGALPRNSVLAAAALAYFSGVHAERRFPHILATLLSPFLSKELLVGVLFTAACVLPALSRAAPAPALSRWPLWASAALFAALAWLNCHSIEHWESVRPRAHTFSAAALLGVSGLLLATVLASTQPRPAALIAAGAASALLLALLHRLRHRLTPLALRAAADLVLLTPLALLVR